MHGADQDARRHEASELARKLRGAPGEAVLPGEAAEASARSDAPVVAVAEEVPVEAPAASAPAPATCGGDADDEDDLDDRSTCESASDDRLAELEDSDAELEEVGRVSADLAAALNSKARWADLEDTEEDEVERPGTAALPLPARGSKATATRAKQRWADIQSDEEDSTPVRQLPPAASKPKGKEERHNSEAAAPAASAASAAAAPAAAGSQQPPRSRGKDKRKQAAPQDRWSSASKRGAGSSWQAPAHRPRNDYSAQAESRWAASSSWAAKPQCQFFIGIEEEPGFKVKSKIIGPHGQNMKSIAQATGAKLRLRGRGSGFLEGDEQRESTDELMLCVSTQDWESYAEAKRLVSQLLNGVYKQYRAFARKARGDEPDLRVQVHEGPRPGSR